MKDRDQANKVTREQEIRDVAASRIRTNNELRITSHEL